MEDLYNQIVDSLEPSKPPHHGTLTVTATVATRDLSDQEDIETRGYWDEDENRLARRGLDDELMERDGAGGVYGQAELQRRAGPYGNTGTAEPPNSAGSNEPGETTAQGGDIVDQVANHPLMQKVTDAHPLIGTIVKDPMAQGAARRLINNGMQRLQGTQSSSG